jgi:hypothetical protein
MNGNGLDLGLETLQPTRDLVADGLLTLQVRVCVRVDGERDGCGVSLHDAFLSPWRVARFVSHPADLHFGQMRMMVCLGIQRWPQRRQWSLGSFILMARVYYEVYLKVNSYFRTESLGQRATL